MYGRDVLANNPHRKPRAIPDVVGEPGLVVECADTGFCGAILDWVKAIEGMCVRLEDRHGKIRVFPARPGAFLIDGELVTLVRPKGATPTGPGRTASGSIAVVGQRAKVAAPSRIWVEGKHDAELVEKVWGADLRIEGVVVESLDGIDNLADLAREFNPAPGRWLGVLVDHLVPGSKETRIAQEVMNTHKGSVLVLGHPFIDIWAAVTPKAAGIAAWPDIPRGEDWKTGTCERLGWSTEPGVAWQALLGRVHKWTDVDYRLLGPVEALIDFVTQR